MQEPPIRQAISLTTETISARATVYRNLVIVIAVGSLAVLFLTIWHCEWRILLSLFWLIPLVSLWLLIDSRLLRQWRDRTASICLDGKLDVSVFSSTIRHFKHLPQNTIEGMLGVLLASLNFNETASKITRNRDTQIVNVKSYFLVFGISTIGCLIMTVSLFLNSWYSVLGIAICLCSAKMSRLFLVRTAA